MRERFTRHRFLSAVGAGATYLALASTVGCEPAERISRAKPATTSVGAFRSRPDLSPPAVEVAKRAHEDTAPGYIFVAPEKGDSGQGGSLIIDNKGQVIWFRPLWGTHERAVNFEVQTYRGEPVLTWGETPGVYVIFDSSYREIVRLEAARALVLVDHAVDQAVLRSLICLEEAVALHVAVDLLLGAARVLRVDLVDALARLEDLGGVGLDVGRLALEARRRLVDEEPGVGQRHPLPLRAAGQQQRPHRHRDPDAHRRHVGLDELHGVVDRQAGVDRAAGRVDVDRDVLLRVLRLEVQELGDDQVGDHVVDCRPEEDDPLVEQPAVDVELALAARGALDDHRDEGHGGVVASWVTRRTKLPKACTSRTPAASRYFESRSSARWFSTMSRLSRAWKSRSERRAL